MVKRGCRSQVWRGDYSVKNEMSPTTVDDQRATMCVIPQHTRDDGVHCVTPIVCHCNESARYESTHRMAHNNNRRRKWQMRVLGSKSPPLRIEVVDQVANNCKINQVSACVRVSSPRNLNDIVCPYHRSKTRPGQEASRPGRCLCMRMCGERAGHGRKAK